MAKAVSLVSALCILAFATVAHCHAPEVFNVEGDVYCDPCRVKFETKLSHKIAGATLKLECSDPITRNVTYSVEGVTDSNGHYKLNVKGDHGDSICEVRLTESPEAECNVPMAGLETARIETQRLLSEPAPGISASPSEENMRYFNVMILGPTESPYEVSIQALLSAPNPDDPLSENIAKHWKANGAEAVETGGVFKLELFLPGEYPMAASKVF
ncbi:unnamed protein product [Fraxinus pennsylvanica]|uniref:Uncharacterized protein n=1 Tax=Fraxinus pennsylvanica TaxID=56036 RepID=A0AAD1YP66_9LAMI|nr:unnamed protein product [Fraxinus pennsylvanica]